MATITQTTNIQTLKINHMSQEVFDSLDTINPNELYLVDSTSTDIGDWTLDGSSIPGHISLVYNGD